ncbi:hypothetical protein K0I73_12245 [Shewanella mesophila]|uniref:secretin N-terminal domain-containing protein n=1 Tax=Shewanella mesophila TaxID=2864208 RepID=UPI001C6597CF|nr:secretin N-terminal domain-containing protein [Shewanella mesophila]QYJ84998.1 hypothetical protein K0I73_12245 [Shewanella mesophila]
MKTVHIITKSLFAFGVMSFLSSCASLSPAINPPIDESFEVDGSFLHTDGNNLEQKKERQDYKKPELAFSEQVINSMDELKTGSPLLTQTPVFSSSEPLKVALNEMEIPQLVHYVFGEVLSISYVMSSDVERMRDKTALNLQKEVTPDELYEITRKILAQHKIEVYSKNNIVYLDKSRSSVANRSVGIGGEAADLPPTGDDIVQLVPYTYNSSRAVISILQKLSNAKAYPDTANRLLVVEGSRADVERALQVIAMLDVPHARGRDIRLLSLVYLTPDELMEQLSELMQAEGLVIGEDIAMVPLNRLNAVVVYSGSSVLGKRVSMWARKIDVATGGESERFYVYRPQFAKAVDLIKSIDILFPRTPTPVASSRGVDDKAGPAAVAPANMEGSIKVTADESQNAIVIHATPNKYHEIMNLLEQLDRLPGQIALQVIVAEVELGNNAQRGIDWFYNEKGIKGGNMGTVDLNASASSLVMDAVRGDWKVALSLLASKTDVRVLSRPYLVVRDGESASINSGVQIPVQTETTSSDTNPDVSRTSVQYRSTGISLSVLPTINADGLVSLEISTETSNVPASSSGEDKLTPAITSRSISTSVFAADGQTVILGGLIQENTTVTDSQVPLLGDIPLLGNLFQNKGNEKSRSELMILITPRIIRDTVDLDDFGKKLSELYSFPVNIN